MTKISEAYVTIRPQTKDFGSEAERGIMAGKGRFMAVGAAIGALVVAEAGQTLAGQGGMGRN